jgi:hypothetical protein
VQVNANTGANCSSVSGPFPAGAVTHSVNGVFIRRSSTHPIQPWTLLQRRVHEMSQLR